MTLGLVVESRLWVRSFVESFDSCCQTRSHEVELRFNLVLVDQTLYGFNVLSAVRAGLSFSGCSVDRNATIAVSSSGDRLWPYVGIFPPP